MCAPNALMPDNIAIIASSQIPPIRTAIVKTVRKLFVRFIDASRSKQIGGSNNESAVSGEIVVVQYTAQVLAQRGLRSRFDREFGRSRRVRSIFRDGIGEAGSLPEIDG